MEHDIETVIQYSMHTSYYNGKDFIAMINTRKNNTERCYLTFVIYGENGEINISISASWEYSKRFDLKSPAYYAEPFYNKDLPPLTEKEYSLALKGIVKQLSKELDL